MTESGAAGAGDASLGSLEVVAAGLAVLTGLVHVYVGLAAGRSPLTLAGVGFFGGVSLYYLGWHREALLRVAVGYTAVQILAWATLRAGEYTAAGYGDKAVQVLLLLALVGVARSDRPEPAGRWAR
ncbi:MAG: hypothetical protein ABEJ22_00850 [Haloferacaceae archaeon]